MCVCVGGGGGGGGAEFVSNFSKIGGGLHLHVAVIFMWQSSSCGDHFMWQSYGSSAGILRQLSP